MRAHDVDTSMGQGVCFDEQVVDCVPTTATDVRLDFVFTPSRTFTRDDDDDDDGDDCGTETS